MAEDESTIPKLIEISKTVCIISDTKKDAAELSSTELKSASLVELLSGTKGRVTDFNYCNSLDEIDRVLSINDAGVLSVKEYKLTENTLYLYVYEPKNTVFATLYSPSGQVAVYQIKSITKKPAL